MKKNTVRALLVAVLVIGLFNLIAFVVPFEHTDVFWIGYGFAMGAFLVVAAAMYTAFGQEPTAKSRFYGFPIARIGAIYGIFQLAASLLCMVLAELLVWWIPVLLFAIAFVAAALGLIAAEAVVDEIRRQDNTQKANTTLMRALQTKVGQIAANSDCAAVKALAEEMRYSDPVSNPAVADAEADLAAAISNLQAAYVDGDKQALEELCRKATVLLAERNRLCKLTKG